MRFPTRGRLLGIDHGLQRIGLAASDGSQMVARELIVIQRKSKAEDFARIQQVIQQEKIVGIVLGMPYNDSIDKGIHQQADTVRIWAERLAAAVPLPILLWDEQYSSTDAQDLARQKRRKPRDPIDDLAARVVLQRYLDALCDGLVEPSTLSILNPLQTIANPDMASTETGSDNSNEEHNT